jgi:hypothetical protein
VRAAIDLHDQAIREAREIYDEMVNRHLLAELEAGLLQLAQLPPQPALRLAPVPAQFACSLVRHGVL